MSLPQEGVQRKAIHALGASPPIPYCTDPFLPLSVCWRLFRLLFSLHNPTFLPRLVFTILPCTMRYIWVLLVCFLHFTIANCNLNLPANLIGLYATTVNIKFHGIFLFNLLFFPEGMEQNKAWGGRVERCSPAIVCNSRKPKDDHFMPLT